MSEHDCEAGHIYLKDGVRTCSVCGRQFPSPRQETSP